MGFANGKDEKKKTIMNKQRLPKLGLREKYGMYSTQLHLFLATNTIPHLTGEKDYFSISDALHHHLASTLTTTSCRLQRLIFSISMLSDDLLGRSLSSV